MNFFRYFRPTSWLKFFASVAVFSLLVITYTEFVHYALVVGLFCRWPSLKDGKNTTEIYRFFVATDTHLFDRDQSIAPVRFRSEFAMRKAYFAAYNMILPRADATFVLGDLTDDGENAKNQDEIADYKSRFDAIFMSNDYCPVYVLFGNHDIGGWGSREIRQEQLTWFNNEFNKDNDEKTSLARLVRFGPVKFVFLNSMAIQSSFAVANCSICDQARAEAVVLSRKLRKKPVLARSRPILLQHIPLFRGSFVSKNDSFCPDVDVMSEDASHFIFNHFRPRLALCGHIHRKCETQFHVKTNGVMEEVSVEAFAWYKGRTSLTLLVADSTEFAIAQCQLPNETTISAIYLGLFVFLLFWLVVRLVAIAFFKFSARHHILVTQSSVHTEASDMSL